MGLLWGIDSADTADAALLGLVKQRAAHPAFWGRYLSSFALTKEEVAFIHGAGIAILPIWNGVDANTVRGTYNQGYLEGESAAHILRSLEAPKGTGLVIDIEASFDPNPEFLWGFCRSCFVGGCVPIVYCAPNSPSAGLHTFAAKMASAPERPYVWSATPEVNSGTGPAMAPKWEPNTLKPLKTVIWQYRESAIGSRVDEDLMDSAISDLLWRPPAHNVVVTPKPEPQAAVSAQVKVAVSVLAATVQQLNKDLVSIQTLIQ